MMILRAKEGFMFMRVRETSTKTCDYVFSLSLSVVHRAAVLFFPLFAHSLFHSSLSFPFLSFPFFVHYFIHSFSSILSFISFLTKGQKWIHIASVPHALLSSSSFSLSLFPSLAPSLSRYKHTSLPHTLSFYPCSPFPCPWTRTTQ